MNKTYNWGFIGSGYIAGKMAEALAILPNARLFAVASRRQETAHDFAAKYKVPNAYGNYAEMVKNPEIDIVYIATPHPFHCENTIMCLEAGKHVVCEKPFGMDATQVKAMIAKAKGKNLFLMEALWSRFLPHIIQVKDLLDKKAIGNVRLMKCDFGIKVPYSLDHRCINRELGGGSLLDVGIYPVFLALFLFGQPKKIIATAGIGETLVDFNCSMCFGYNDDKLSVLYSSVVAKTQTTTQIFGNNGCIEIDRDWFMPSNYKVTIGGEETYYKPDFVGNGMNYEAANVMKCLDEGKLESDIWSLQNSVELIEILDEIRHQCGITYS